MVGRPASELTSSSSTDTAHWQKGSRRVRSVKTPENGAYQVDGLPTGEYTSVRSPDGTAS
jgi:hypothetical protein